MANEKPKDDNTCEECGADIVIIDYFGKKQTVNAKATKGFVFIEDEYGEAIGEPEIISIHELHDETCQGSGEVANTDGATGIKPLSAADVRTEKIMFTDGEESMEIDQQMRTAAPDTYHAACSRANSRTFIKNKGTGADVGNK